MIFAYFLTAFARAPQLHGQAFVACRRRINRFSYSWHSSSLVGPPYFALDPAPTWPHGKPYSGNQRFRLKASPLTVSVREVKAFTKAACSGRISTPVACQLSWEDRHA